MKPKYLHLEQRRKYNEVQTTINQNDLTLASLSTLQLKILCAYKKRSNDKYSILKLKHDNVLYVMETMDTN